MSSEPVHGPHDGSVADLVRRSLGGLSASERKVARALLAAYPVAGLETVARLAARAEVSGPTVVRFVARLGFDGYAAFQQALREDLAEQAASPLALYERAERRPADDLADDLVSRAGASARAATAATFDSLPADEVDRAVELLATSRRVLLSGGRYSGLLARYLHQHLEQLRPRATMVPDAVSSRAATVSELSRKDVVVLFDFRRYEPPAQSLALEARRRHARVLLFTDSFLSPVAASADVVLAAHVASVSPFDTMATTMFLVETCIAGVVDRLGDAARDRMAAIEAAAGQLELY
jgi:DNA-binding MurR/RpiR family transcriptional regulator